MRLRCRTVLLAALAAAPMAWAQPTAAPPPPSPPAQVPQPSTPVAASPAAAAATHESGVADLLHTRIEQVRRGNRVAEVRVTSNSGEPLYTMENREGRTTPATQGMGSGLSTPNFLRIEF